MLQFNPSTASVLMALPRDKKALTVREIGATVRLNVGHTTDWLIDLHQLGLALQVGQRHVPTRGSKANPDLKWRLSANGLKVVRVLAGAV
jgi:hypothetical protein